MGPVATRTLPALLVGAPAEAHEPAGPPARAGGRVRSHHARGRGRARAPRAAVQRRARTRSSCCAWPRRPSAPARSPSRSCTWTRATTSPRSSSSATAACAELGERLIVASVQDSIDAGRVREEHPAPHPRASRNRLQTRTLLDAIAAHGFDAAFGGARRDEERARAKERVFSFRDEFGAVGPARPAARAVEPLQRADRPGRARARVPALQLDRARRLALHRRGGARAALDLLRARAHVLERDGMLLARLAVRAPVDGEGRSAMGALPHGRRPDGDGRRALQRGHAADVVAEIAATTVTERGQTRADDRTSEAAMEDRKREGYF